MFTNQMYENVASEHDNMSSECEMEDENSEDTEGEMQ
jgi:hypothetical protein